MRYATVLGRSGRGRGGGGGGRSFCDNYRILKELLEKGVIQGEKGCRNDPLIGFLIDTYVGLMYTSDIHIESTFYFTPDILLLFECLSEQY